MLSAIFIGLLFVFTLAVLFLCARVPFRPDTDERQVIGWQSGTRFFLVLLRLAIGWHFLIEGLYKFEQTSWSSEMYLREATGPLAPTFRWLAGDSLKERLTPGPGGEFPDALARDWQAHLNAFSKHYGLSDEQSAQAKTTVDQCKHCTLHWMTGRSKSIKVPRKHLTYSRDMTVPERVQAYETLEQELRRIEEIDIPTHGKDAFVRYREVKDDVTRIRRELKADLDRQARDVRSALEDVLTAEQKEEGALPERVGKPIGDWTRLDWSDAIVKYALVIAGACLLGGLLTRTACITGALLVLLFYLPLMPLPGWPDSPRSEGHYLWINKNIIEMLALLVLATTRSGRWVGLDGLIHGIWKLFMGPREIAPVAPAKETTHGT